MAGRPKLIVVSATSEEERLAPRASRLTALAPELEKSWDVEIFPGPWKGGRPDGLAERAAQRLNRRLARHIAIDAYEPSGLRTFWRWRPRAELALLMGWPLSWTAAAARRLRDAGVPYAVDAGDPWVLTAPAPEGGRLPHRRRAAAERQVWRYARGAVLTTARQEQALRALFPHLPTLVQPSGYRPIQTGKPARRWAAGEPLELAHFGVLYRHRIDFGPALGRLAAQGPWPELVLHQFGAAAGAGEGPLPPGVSLRRHDPVPWEEVPELLPSFHALLVIGNVNPAQLPSKTIDYGALPAPRIALVAEPRDDAIADYVATRPGWLVLGAHEDGAAPRVAEHVSRAWSETQLAPRQEDSWAVAGPAVRSFLEELAARP